MDFMSFFPGLSGGGTCEGETLQHFIEKGIKKEKKKKLRKIERLRVPIIDEIQT
jgi:hypothetical protein